MIRLFLKDNSHIDLCVQGMTDETILLELARDVANDFEKIFPFAGGFVRLSEVNAAVTLPESRLMRLAAYLKKK